MDDGLRNMDSLDDLTLGIVPITPEQPQPDDVETAARCTLWADDEATPPFVGSF